MSAFRLLLRTHSRLALLLVALALLVKAMVPPGYMVGRSSKTFTISICADGSGEMQTRAITVPMTPESQHGAGDSAPSGKACGYSAMSMAALGGTEAPLLALALAFVLALGLATTPRLLLKQSSHLRPPLRGPPVPA